MKEIHASYYIPVFFETNSYSAEKLVGGILFFAEKQVLFRYAENKIKASVQIGNLGSAQMLRQTMKTLAEKVKTQKELFNPAYLEYLRRYSNGLIQFGEPNQILLSVEDFEEFAIKFLGEKNNLSQLVYQKLSTIKNLEKQASIKTNIEISPNNQYKVVLKTHTQSFVLQTLSLENSFETARKNFIQYTNIIKKYPNIEFALITQNAQSEYQKQILQNFEKEVPQCKVLYLTELVDFVRNKVQKSI